MFIKKGLKIFVDGYLLNKEHQGTKTYIKELYKEFAAQNPNFSIYIGCFKDRIIEEEFSGQKNIKFIYYKDTKRIFRMFFEIPNIISKNKFDYAHFQYVIPLIRNRHCKYIVTIHDILFNDFPEYFSKAYRLKRNFLFGYSARKADILISVSEYSKQRIQKFYNLGDKKIYITPNGVSEAFLKPYTKEKAIDYISKKYGINNYMLYVSRIEPRKNQQAILSVFPLIENKDVNMVFIGEKTLENKILEKQLKELPLNVKKRIHFLNNISENDLLEFYKASRVFLYPTFAEGFGIPPLEAAALKIPVICSNKTALKDFHFFKPNLIDINQLNIFKEKIENVLTTNDINLENIQKYILTNYSWKKCATVLQYALKQKNV